MASEPRQELVEQICHLLGQAADGDGPVLARITTAVAVGPYVDALVRDLVNEAREQGHSWGELAEVFATSPANVKHRFGSYRQYDDDDSS